MGKLIIPDDVTYHQSHPGGFYVYRPEFYVLSPPMVEHLRRRIIAAVAGDGEGGAVVLTARQAAVLLARYTHGGGHVGDEVADVEAMMAGR